MAWHCANLKEVEGRGARLGKKKIPSLEDMRWVLWPNFFEDGGKEWKPLQRLMGTSRVQWIFACQNCTFPSTTDGKKWYLPMFSQASSLNSSTMAFRGQPCQPGSRNRDFDVFFQQCVFRQKPGEWPDSLLLCLKIPSRALSSPFSILGSQGIPPSFRLPYSDFLHKPWPLESS